jgi:thioredoxin-dependent peroxiredoxin
MRIDMSSSKERGVWWEPISRLAIYALITIGSVQLALRNPHVRSGIDIERPLNAGRQAPHVGQPAPDFTLDDVNRQAYHLSRHRGKMLMINFFCGCGKCFGVTHEWMNIQKANPGLQVWAVSALTRGDTIRWCREAGLTGTILLDTQQIVARRYAAIQCPRSYLLNEDGKILYVSRTAYEPGIVTAEIGRRLRATAEQRLRAK